MFLFMCASSGYDVQQLLERVDERRWMKRELLPGGERPSRVFARDCVKSFRSSYTGLHPQSGVPLRVSRNSGGCYAERTLSRPLPTDHAFESDDGDVTRTQSSRSRQGDTAEEMYDEQL